MYISKNKSRCNSDYRVIVILILAIITLYPSFVFAQPKCNGQEATIIGTAEDDVIEGTSGPDVIVGLAGNDVIRGFEGDDVICGGFGNDLLIGGSGNDQLFGGRGADTLRGKAGNDLLNGGRGNNFLDGGTGTDECNRQIGFVTFTNCEPTGGHNCDFTPDKSGDFYTQGDCADLADAFDCESISFQNGICKVFGCIGCLCDAGRAIPDLADDCSTFNGNCFNSFRDSFLGFCHGFVCFSQLPCGSFSGIF